MTKSPFNTQFDDPRPGLIRQELVTYEMIKGKLIRTTVVRNFFDDDYTDSMTTTPIQESINVG